MKRIFSARIGRKRKLPDYMTTSGAMKMAKVNGGIYDGDKLTESGWQWPTDTWFQQRRRTVGGDSESRPGA